MIIALAGRRVDSTDSLETRFPMHNIEKVRIRIRETFTNNAATALVSSAACGADLIALAEAGKLGLRRRVILPFNRQRFRESSVVDRPGDWGDLYDELLDRIEETEDLIVLQDGKGEKAYSAVNCVILDEALALSREYNEPVSAVLVWDGISRGNSDLTEEFGIEAHRRGLTVVEVSTI
jgi:hypothetical protein